MEKSRLEIKVGLFVFIGLALLAVVLVQLSKGTSLFRGTYTLRLHAVNVGGLKPRSSVLLAGVQVGSVDQIELAPDGKSVTILLKVYKQYPIYSDARFVIEQAGFLGDQYVSVVPTLNQAPPWTNNADVDCQEPFNLQEVARSAAGFIKRLDGTATKLDDAVTDLRQEVLNAKTLASFGIAITNLQAFTDQALDAVHHINGLVTTNGSAIGVAVSNVVFFSTELNRLADSAQGLLDTNGANLTTTTKNLADISVSGKQFAADIQAGRGLAGTILENQELATNVQAIVANLSIASSNLNRLGLWGILWSHKPPGTNPTTFNLPRQRQ